MSTHNKVLVDYRIHKDSVTELENMGYEPVFTIKHRGLYDAVNGHSDMMLYRSYEKIIAEPRLFDVLSEQDIGNIKIINGKQCITDEYPLDIPYNAAELDGYIIHNLKYTNPEILKLYSSEKRIHVNQGYTKCNLCIIKNAAITSDEGIYNKLKSKFDILKIRQGYIELPGMNYGFIGGATGFIDNTLIVNGSLKTHPDYHNIVAFVKNYNVDIAELNIGKLYDIGTIIPLF